MSTIKRFEDLDVWQMSRQLCQEIYELTLIDAFSKDFSLKDQIRRSSGSVMDNIAEGFERGGRKGLYSFFQFQKARVGNQERSCTGRWIENIYQRNNSIRSTTLPMS